MFVISVTETRPRSSCSSVVMQRVSMSSSRISFQTSRRLISPSIPGRMRKSMSFICGLTLVMRRGAFMFQ